MRAIQDDVIQQLRDLPCELLTDDDDSFSRACSWVVHLAANARKYGPGASLLDISGDHREDDMEETQEVTHDVTEAMDLLWTLSQKGLDAQRTATHRLDAKAVGALCLAIAGAAACIGLPVALSPQLVVAGIASFTIAGLLALSVLTPRDGATYPSAIIALRYVERYGVAPTLRDLLKGMDEAKCTMQEVGLSKAAFLEWAHRAIVAGIVCLVLAAVVPIIT